MSSPYLISSHPLQNGLTLSFLDQSRKIAADRWYVCVVIRIDIPLERKWFDDRRLDEMQFQQIKSALGDEVVFEQKKERNFVSADQKDRIVEALCRGAVELAVPYFGHKDFAAKYILRTYNDRQCRRG